MQRTDGRKYFIVKHPLDALEALPNFIWNSGEPKNHLPKGFGQVKRGDRWIGFAHTTTDARERPLSLITGFFECTREARYGKIPKKALSTCIRGETEAWQIEGKACGLQPNQPVGVPPIDDLLGRTTFNQATLVSINAKEFAKIRDYTRRHEFHPGKIPLLGREPKCEQEVLAVVVCGHKKLGIERIVRVQTRFPDLLVKIKGKAEEVHLELEVYSKGFLGHGHDRQVDKKGRFPKKTGKNADKKPVAILCWIDNEKSSTLNVKGRKVKDCVHRVYELQSLIREGRKIRW